MAKLHRVLGGAVVVCIALATSAMATDHAGQGKGKDRDHRWEHRDNRGGSRPIIWDRHHDRGRDSRPHGWNKGKKTGWGDCDVPPGQAKKKGCYDRDRRWRHRSSTRRPKSSTNVGTWRRPGQTTSTTTTTTTKGPGTWRRPEITQQTTTTTTKQSPTGTWRRP